MIRKAFMIQTKPGMAAEYQRRHNPIWADLEKALKIHGVTNYSIFQDEDTGFLFGYMEIEDEEKFQQIGEVDVVRRWWRYMTEVLVCKNGKRQKAKESNLKEVFHMD